MRPHGLHGNAMSVLEAQAVGLCTIAFSVPTAPSVIATAWIAVRSASTEAGGKPIKLPGKVTKLVEELSRDGLDAVAKVVSYVGPRPAQGIAEIAREAGADVIVVGTRGHSALGGLVVGSVARRLLHVAPCPV